MRSNHWDRRIEAYSLEQEAYKLSEDLAEDEERMRLHQS